MKKLFLSLLPLIGLISGCTLTPKDDGDDPLDPPGPSGEYSEPIDPFNPGSASPKLVASNEYKNLFTPSNKVTFKIDLPLESARFINTYQTDHNNCIYHDYYVPCSLTYKIGNGTETTIEEVGIRAKGNLSRRTFLEGDVMNRSAHFKLKFDETFDGDEYDEISALAPFKKTWESSDARKERSKRRFAQLKALDIKWNRNDDETRVKQDFGLKLFRDNGVMAQYTNLADTTFSIDGNEYHDIYEIFEPIDGVFINHRFASDEADGDLYKCTYTDKGPANFKASCEIGVEDNTRYYHPTYDLKTNKKTNTTHTALKNLFSVMNSNLNDDTKYQSELEKVFNIDGFMKYEAVAFLLGNFDDIRNNANNYYIYFSNKTSMSYVIPYDFDRLLGTGCENRKNYMTDFSADSTKMQCSNDWQSMNIYWKTVCRTTSGHPSRIEEYYNMYTSKIAELINNETFSPSAFTSYVNQYSSEFNCNPSGAGNDNISFSDYYNLKLAAIKSNNPEINITK